MARLRVSTQVDGVGARTPRPRYSTTLDGHSSGPNVPSPEPRHAVTRLEIPPRNATTATGDRERIHATAFQGYLVSLNRVLIVEDEGLFRDMLGATLSSQPNIQIVGSASNGPDAIDLATKLRPEVVVTDIDLGDGPNGIEVGMLIKSKPPYPGIVILSAHKDRQYVANLNLAQASGWSYLLKRNVKDTEALMRAIRGAALGLMTVDREVLEELAPRPETAVGVLTDRQLNVLKLVAQAYTDAEVGEALGLEATYAREEVSGVFKALDLAEDEPAVARVRAVLLYVEETKIKMRTKNST